MSWRLLVAVLTVGALVQEATVTREVDGGLQTIKMPLPAVVSADLRLNVPRYIKLPDIVKARKKKVDTLNLDDLGIDTAPRITCVRACVCARPRLLLMCVRVRVCAVPAVVLCLRWWICSYDAVNEPAERQGGGRVRIASGWLVPVVALTHVSPSRPRMWTISLSS